MKECVWVDNTSTIQLNSNDNFNFLISSHWLANTPSNLTNFSIWFFVNSVSDSESQITWNNEWRLFKVSFPVEAIVLLNWSSRMSARLMGWYHIFRRLIHVTQCLLSHPSTKSERLGIYFCCPVSASSTTHPCLVSAKRTSKITRDRSRFTFFATRDVIRHYSC